MVEAVNVFNQIPAGVNGKITKVLLSDGDKVEFGQAMFLVKETQLALGHPTAEAVAQDVEDVASQSHHADLTEGHSASRGNALSMNVAIVLLLAAAVVIMATFFLTSK